MRALTSHLFMLHITYLPISVSPTTFISSTPPAIAPTFSISATCRNRIEGLANKTQDCVHALRSGSVFLRSLAAFCVAFSHDSPRSLSAPTRIAKK